MSDYGIRIMVKFREADKLRRLDHQVLMNEWRLIVMIC